MIISYFGDAEIVSVIFNDLSQDVCAVYQIDYSPDNGRVGK